MSFSFGLRAVASFASLASLASLTACAAPQTTTDAENLDVSNASATAATSTYARLEQIAPGAYTFSRVNGGKLHCPNGTHAATCTVSKLDLPADCGWECQDGLLSLQGVTVLRGDFKTAYDASHHKVTTFAALAGFDTIDATLGTHPVYRVTQHVAPCLVAPCPVLTTATRVNDSSSRGITRVDFSHAHDTNYVIDPSRGIAQIARPEGLVVSGSIVSGVLEADRVWRQWTPEADCDVPAAARAFFFKTPAPQGEVNLEFATTLAAESYVDPQHRTVNWLVRTDKNALAIAYTGGFNDLWAQTFTVSTTTCAVTLTGEH